MWTSAFYQRFFLKNNFLINNTSNTIHTITSPNMMMNTDPPIPITRTVTTVNIATIVSKINNNNILLPPYYKIVYVSHNKDCFCREKNESLSINPGPFRSNHLNLIRSRQEFLPAVLVMVSVFSQTIVMIPITNAIPNGAAVLKNSILFRFF